jgi:Type I phosphodiesterase / nucleotide pyrophosphatase
MLRAGPPAPVDIGTTAGARRSDARLASVPTVSAGQLVATEADDAPVLPDYAGANVRGIVPALLGPGDWSSLPGWFPEPARHARQAVLLVLDGLGWEQLQSHRSQLPVLSSLAASTLTTVAPTTTATALSSIATGLTPGEHGLIGYRMYVQGEVINVLRWVAAGGDRRRSLPPREVQPFAAFLGADVPVISPAELEHTAFTEAHLRGSRPVGYRAASAIAVEIGRQLRAGERFVYAYYGGVDKTAHERGFGDFYDAELRAADRIVGDILDALVPGSTLLVTADHGQVEVGDRVIAPDPDLLDMVALQSGEGRFRWWHASRGATAELLAGATARYGDVAWVVTREQTVDEGWFGATVAPPVLGRLGDVALVARDPVSFFDPNDAGPFELVCRHGSLTAAEVLVPLLASVPS